MNLFVTKQITLLGLHATAADALAVGAVLCLNMLQEFYGKKIAKHALWLSFAGAVYYVLVSLLHCSYIPAQADISNVHFIALLSPMPRILIASLVAYLLSQLVDRALYGFFSKMTAGKYFVLRNYITVAIAQLLDTILFAYGALWGNVQNLGEIILVSYAIKLAIMLLATPLLLLAQKVMRCHVQL